MRNLLSGTKGLYSPGHLCFVAEQAESALQLLKIYDPVSVSLEMSTDLVNWSDYTIGDTIGLDNVGDKVYLRNKSTTDTGFSISDDEYYKFVGTGKIACHGDIGYLLNKYSTDTMSTGCFAKLFYGANWLTSAPALPSRKIAERCYSYMFYNCSSLTEAPELPATTLYEHCYKYMFLGTGLIKAPDLPTTTLPNWAYQGMFKSCRSLVNAPVISATTVGQAALSETFSGCTSLVTPPALPATIIGRYGYSRLFQDCTSLKYAPVLSADNVGVYGYEHMFDGCTNLEQLPALPATFLTGFCYFYMFYGCSKIKLSSTQTGEYVNEYRIPIAGTGSKATSETKPMEWMFTNTGGTWKGEPSMNTTYYTSNTVVS